MAGPFARLSREVLEARGMTLEEITEMLRLREGAECIYKESRTICAARIRSIHADEHRISFDLVPLPSPGLSGPIEPWTSGAAWDVFSVEAESESWTAASSGLVWRMYFHPDFIRDIKEFARTLPESEDEVERSQELVSYIHRSTVKIIRQKLRHA